MPSAKDQRATKPATRIGYGFDSHEFRSGTPLKLGGITLAHDKGLRRAFRRRRAAARHHRRAARGGGCARYRRRCSRRPIAKWKGADSARLPAGGAEAGSRHAGYSVANIDASLILAAPKIGPHAAAIPNARVAQLLGVPADCVGLKAKTPEGLEPGEYAAVAHVVVLLEKRGEIRRRRGRRRSRVFDFRLSI
jgi:2-C-methyl-D-erythritol 2,4-cyclodiphosphate synthase